MFSRNPRITASSPLSSSPLRIVWDEKQPFSRDKYLWSGWNCLKTILKTSSLTRIFQSVPFQLPAEADKTRVLEQLLSRFKSAFYIRIQLHHTHSWMENILWSVKSPEIRIKRIHNCALKWELTWIFVVWKWKVWYSYTEHSNTTQLLPPTMFVEWWRRH